MEGPKGRRQIEIFNFSFLDILACTIGLLIFIMSIVVISGNMNATARQDQAGKAIAQVDAKIRLAQSQLDAAARRRRTAEERLKVSGGEISNAPELKDGAARIAALKKEEEQLEKLLKEDHAALDELTHPSTDVDRALALQQELDDLERQAARLEQGTADMLRQSKDLPKTPPKPIEVSFYVPRIQESTQDQSWLELENGFVYVLDNRAYITTKISPTETRWDRLPQASGVSVERLVKSSAIPLAQSVEDLRPSEIVLNCIVRTDSFEDFYRIRDVAWKKGFAVNWYPEYPKDPILLYKGKGQKQ